MEKTIKSLPATRTSRASRLSFINLEILSMNKWLFISWIIAVALFAAIHSIGVNNFSLAGMTENKAYIINYSQPVIVDKVLIQSGQTIKKGDVLFYLLRPDLTIMEKKNTAELRQAVVEMNILSNRSFSIKKWKSLLNRKSKGVGLGRRELSPQELHFLALVEMLDFNKEEQKKLRVTSPIDGHAGTINFNVGETVSPYSPLVSLHQSQPTIVKSYIPESYDITRFHAHRSAVIQSMTREARTSGKIVTIGTVLTELPQRFQMDPTNKLFGREITVSLSEDNKLYLGEKVLVKIEEP